MKASDFNMQRDLKFSPDTGITTFRNSRFVLFDASAIGLLRQELLDAVGWETARTLFLRFGYQNGYADYMQLKEYYDFDSEVELLSAGPVIHTWEGIVKSTAKEFRIDREKGDLFHIGLWENSYEAEQYLSYNHPAKEPVCWSLMGYASGYCSAALRAPVLAIETLCVGKGDDRCEVLAKPLPAWGDEAQVFREALKSFQGGD